MASKSKATPGGVREGIVWQRAMSDFVWQVRVDGVLVANGSARSEGDAWAAAGAEGVVVDAHTYQADNPEWVTDPTYTVEQAEANANSRGMTRDAPAVGE